MQRANRIRETAIMTWVMRVFAAFVVIGILAAFFFPVTAGPYTAVNGPATAFRSVHYSALLRVAVVLAGVSLQAGTAIFHPLRWPAKTEIGTARVMTGPDLDQFCVRLC